MCCLASIHVQSSPHDGIRTHGYSKCLEEYGRRQNMKTRHAELCVYDGVSSIYFSINLSTTCSIEMRSGCSEFPCFQNTNMEVRCHTWKHKPNKFSRFYKCSHLHSLGAFRMNVKL